MEFNPRPASNDPERPWIGDLPGQGSQGPSDLPQKETCPHCGQPHKGGVRKDNPVTEQTVLSEYRGQQQGRGGHFDSGHQKLYPALLTPEEEFGLVGPQPHPQTFGYGPFPPKTPAERGRDEHGRLAEGASRRDKEAWLKSDRHNSPAFKQHGLSEVEARVLSAGSEGKYIPRHERRSE